MAATADASEGVEPCPKPTDGSSVSTATATKENTPSDFVIATPHVPAERRAAVQPPGWIRFGNLISGKQRFPNAATIPASSRAVHSILHGTIVASVQRSLAAVRRSGAPALSRHR